MPSKMNFMVLCNAHGEASWFRVQYDEKSLLSSSKEFFTIGEEKSLGIH